MTPREEEDTALVSLLQTAKLFSHSTPLHKNYGSGRYIFQAFNKDPPN